MEHPPQEVALQRVGQLGPVVAHRLHAHDLETLPLAFEPQARIPLGPAPGLGILPVLGAGPQGAHGRKEEAQVHGLELQLEPGFHRPALAHVAREALVHQAAQSFAHPAQLGRRGAARESGAHEQRVRVAVEHLETFLGDEVAGPEEHVLAERGDGTGQLGGGEPAPLGAEHAVERVHHDLVRVG